MPKPNPPKKPKTSPLQLAPPGECAYCDSRRAYFADAMQRRRDEAVRQRILKQGKAK